MTVRLAMCLAFVVSMIGCASRESGTQLWLRRGDDLVRTERYDAALEVLEEARKDFPESVATRIRLARLHLLRDNAAGALSPLQESMKILEESRPPVDRAERAEVQFLLGQVLERSSREGAIAHYARAVSAEPNRSDYHSALLAAYVRAGRLDAARKAFGTSPGFGGPLFLLGLTQLIEGQPEPAAFSFRTLRRYSEDLPTFRMLEALAILGGTATSTPLVAEVRTAQELASSPPRTPDLLWFLVQGRLEEAQASGAAGARYAAARGERLHMVDPQLPELTRDGPLRDAIGDRLGRLELALRDQVLAGLERTQARLADEQRPVIGVDPVTDVTANGFAVLTGTVTDDRSVAQVRVAGQAMPLRRPNPSGRSGDVVEFAARVPLQVGINHISIEAEDSSKNVEVARVRIDRVRVLPPFDPRRRWALFVSVRRFRDEARLPARPGGRLDVPVLIRRLADGIPAGQVERLVDERATKEAILGAAGELTRIGDLTPEEVFVYLDTSVRFLAEGKEEPRPYLLPHDADPADLRSSSIELSELAKLLEAVPAKRLVLLVDSSHGGQAFRSQAFVGRPGRVVLAAAQELAYIDPGLDRRAVFPFYMVQAMNVLAIRRTALRPTVAPALSIGAVFDLARDRVVESMAGKQIPITLGDREAAFAFTLADTEARDAGIGEIADLLLRGLLTREQYLVAARALTSEVSDADRAIADVLLKYLQRRIPAGDLGRQLLSARESTR